MRLLICKQAEVSGGWWAKARSQIYRVTRRTTFRRQIPAV